MRIEGKIERIICKRLAIAVDEQTRSTDRPSQRCDGPIAIPGAVLSPRFIGFQSALEHCDDRISPYRVECIPCHAAISRFSFRKDGICRMFVASATNTPMLLAPSMQKRCHRHAPAASLPAINRTLAKGKYSSGLGQMARIPRPAQSPLGGAIGRSRRRLHSPQDGT